MRSVIASVDNTDITEGLLNIYLSHRKRLPKWFSLYTRGSDELHYKMFKSIHLGRQVVYNNEANWTFAYFEKLKFLIIC